MNKRNIAWLIAGVVATAVIIWFVENMLDKYAADDFGFD